MRVKNGTGREHAATIHEDRNGAILVIEGRACGTFSALAQRLELVEATPQDRAILRALGYVFDGEGRP